MIRIPTRFALFSAVLLSVACAAPAFSSARMLEDSTTVDSWVLPNGLRVVTRDVPRARGVAMVLCYRSGSSQDPAGREGLAALLAELRFRGAATDAPERSRDEIAMTRPAGWNLRVTPYLTTLAEIASVSQFPGVFHQVAARAAGVTVSDALMKSALVSVKQDQAENYAVALDRAIYYDLRTLAARGTPAALEAYATGKGLDGITLKDAQQMLPKVFAPAGAVLSIAGAVSQFNMRRLVDNEFGKMAGGDAPPPIAPEALKSGSFRLPFATLKTPVGGIGILGPALTDSLHPSFALHALLLGSFCRNRWGAADAPLTTRFDYALLDDPEVARLYPGVSPDPYDKTAVTEELYYTLAEVPVQLEREAYDDGIKNLGWLLGGPMPEALVQRMRKDGGALYTLASGMGARAQWGDDAFWAEYRRRFERAAGRDLPYWRNYFGATEKMVQLRLVPAKDSAAAR